METGRLTHQLYNYMFGKDSLGNRSSQAQVSGFTLVEVALAMSIIAMVFSITIVAYIHACTRAKWSGYSLAAQALAVQQIEQARSAVWDPTQNPPVDELANLPTKTTNQLNLPISGTNVLFATNYITVSLLTNNGSQFHMVRVDTVWNFVGYATNRVHIFTNTAVSYFAPDNPDPSDF